MWEAAGRIVNVFCLTGGCSDPTLWITFKSVESVDKYFPRLSSNIYKYFPVNISQQGSGRTNEVIMKNLLRSHWQSCESCENWWELQSGPLSLVEMLLRLCSDWLRSWFCWKARNATEGGHFIPSRELWVPLSVFLWHKRAGVSNTSHLISDLKWTSLEVRERERERELHYICPPVISALGRCWAISKSNVP